MNFFSKKGFFSFLLLSATLATLHGTSKNQYDLTRKKNHLHPLLTGDVNLKERLGGSKGEIKKCEGCDSNEHIMVNADELRSFFTEKNKALFNANRIKSYMENISIPYFRECAPITDAEYDSYRAQQDSEFTYPEFNFTARCSSCHSDVIINLYTDFVPEDTRRIINFIILYTQPDYEENLALKAQKAREAEESHSAVVSSHGGGAYGYSVESSAASVSGGAGTGAGSGFGSADGGGYGYRGGSGAASAYDAENTARKLAEEARIAAERAKAEIAAGDATMARLQAEKARKAAEELRARQAAEEASRERFEATERVAAAQEAHVITTNRLDIPAFRTRNAALFKPDGTTILFRADVLVVLPPAKMPHGAQFQYKISEYDGPMRDSTSQYWQDTRLDAGQDSFTLPVGIMKVQVRMITRHNNQASPPSPAYEFRVKGA